MRGTNHCWSNYFLLARYRDIERCVEGVGASSGSVSNSRCHSQRCPCRNNNSSCDAPSGGLKPLSCGCPRFSIDAH